MKEVIRGAINSYCLKASVDYEKGTYSITPDGDANICCPECGRWTEIAHPKAEIHFNCINDFCDYKGEITLEDFEPPKKSGLFSFNEASSRTEEPEEE